ncbi:CheR family methyltransferase [Noviherbaspirillum suwonense]|jgi:chemotaxis protein methyltransferase CheR|uniref:Chemotaxis protein methyltransferase n=1 Tax=Noviherbaspirillum suwonense TaxID=1224511 RepID=A0ABY1QJM5_9BURK|nr:CheR family methyltransferase [Noviherbaspirillum suwonense]SMP71403.1 MCP methyltransferase, CheR-type [Noviherbaspirillum suwonense]
MKASREQRGEGLKEFDFTVRDFERVRALIYKRAGIALAPGKQEMVYSRLARRLRSVGIQSFEQYLDRLERDRDSAEWEAFTNALTTNLTSFFREEHHFPILADHVRDRRDVSVWCSAASTGEEPYSIAMTLCETYGTLTPPAQILATDIDTNVLATAAAGIYPAERVERLSPERLRRFFLRGTGAQAGLVRVRPELRKLVTFQQLNLLDESYQLRSAFDVVFCRNVMIYFDKPTQGRILSRFAPLIKPDGLLFAGHSENFLYVSDAFKLRAKTVYQLATARAT